MNQKLADRPNKVVVNFFGINCHKYKRRCLKLNLINILTVVNATKLSET